MLLAWVCLGVIPARAEQAAPRDIWNQAINAAVTGDIQTATRKTNELTDAGKADGVRSFPLYAATAAALSRQADRSGNKEVASWASGAAGILDPTSAEVAFVNADHFVDQHNYAKALSSSLTGYIRTLRTTRGRLLARSDSLIIICLAVFLAAVVLAISLFIRYGRSMAHDFRELVAEWLSGGSVSVVAFALLFLPLFLWLGPLWLLFYWFVIFFGYASLKERVAILVMSLAMAAVPVLLDRSAAWIGGIDSPVVTAATASAEQSYRPEALRRLQEVVSIVPDNADLHLLLGNLHLQEGNAQQALGNYRKAAELTESAGAHVNLGNLHFIDNDFTAAITEYERAEQLDPKMAIAFYNNSVASGETYKFDEQGQKIEQAKKMDRALIDRLLSNPPPQKIVMYQPTVERAWQIATTLARQQNTRSLFGTYAYFDLAASLVNPITIGAILAALLAVAVWMLRRRSGYAAACIKCGRTFCHRCKSSRESATFCTQCIHIYLKRDGVSLDTKRHKLDEVQRYQSGNLRRNKLFAIVLPGSAQLIEGRTIAGVIALLLFFIAVGAAIFVGHLAPVLGPGDIAKLAIRVVSIAIAVVIWLCFSIPALRRRVSV
jgi:tetratricopeptide (TPR) repeat protein